MPATLPHPRVAAITFGVGKEKRAGQTFGFIEIDVVDVDLVICLMSSLLLAWSCGNYIYDVARVIF